MFSREAPAASLILPFPLIALIVSDIPENIQPVVAVD